VSARRRIVVLAAGLSQPSSTRLLADRLGGAAAHALARQGVEADVEVVELRDHAHAITDAMLTGFPSGALREVVDAVAAADAVIAVTPIFTASYSGLFKSFVDVLEPDSLTEKPVLLAATAGTARHSLALEHALRPLFAYLRAVVVPTAVFAASEDWGAGTAAGTGNGVQRSLADRVERAAGELAALVAAREPARVADPFAQVTPFEQLLRGA
jgi:FMN reductase